MIPPMDRLRIQVLRDAGHSLREVATLVGVSSRSVQRIEHEPPISGLDAAPTPVSRGVGRPSKVAPFRSFIADLLGSDPALPTVEVLHRLRGVGYAGGKSAVYALVRELRPARPEPPMVRFEGVAGEFSQHDFGSVRVTYADGTKERVHFLVSRLKYSRSSHVVVVPDE